MDNFYKESCPNAEAVIGRAVITAVEKNLKLAAGLIRLQFHDCFVAVSTDDLTLPHIYITDFITYSELNVRKILIECIWLTYLQRICHYVCAAEKQGCDGSVLLDGNETEKTAPVNEHLKGFKVVDAAKAAVEKVCPGVVSCADVLAHAARDSTVADGLVSSANAAERELPPPTFNVSQLIESFARRGLSAEQMVVFPESHTVGFGHCDKFIERFYNFSETHRTDPSLNSILRQAAEEGLPKMKLQQNN
ncbi:hypothetical protein Mapa_002239 [Marchantia paleacea]|nr:hypothetical protein Mapa_002239 [Marchantia paleacea]